MAQGKGIGREAEGGQGGRRSIGGDMGEDRGAKGLWVKTWVRTGGRRNNG